MKLIKGVFCYLIAFNMAQRGQCPFEECEGYLYEKKDDGLCGSVFETISERDISS